MEQLKEENHKLILKLENLKKSHSTEVEYLREEQEIKDQEFKQQLVKLKEEAKGREELKTEKIQVLTEEINSLRDEHDETLQQVEKYRVQLEILKNPKTAGACSSYSEYEGLKESQRTLKVQLQEKDDLLTSQTEKIRALGDEIKENSSNIAELTEIVEGKDSLIKDLTSRLKELEREKEEECGVLQNEVLGLKEEIKALMEKGNGVAGGSRTGGGTTSASTRGNSLFSEVEERRLKVENELTRLRNHVKRLTEENRNLQLELERGDTHSATITTQLEVITRSEQELFLEIKKDKSEVLNLFDSYRDRLESLRNEYTRKLVQYKANSSSPQGSELESLRRERDSLTLVRLTMEREINELKRELKYNKHLRTNAEANLKILKAKLDNTKMQQSQDDNKMSKSPIPDVNANDSPTPLNIREEKLEKISTPSTPNPLVGKNSGIKSRRNDQECKQQ